MIEAGPYRKNKINLKDYDFEKDIKNRVLMSHLSPSHIEILEELVYGPSKFSLDSLSSQLDKTIDELVSLLEDLRETELFDLKDDTVHINKEMRRYFEAQIVKFEENFTPGMEFLRTLLKKVPIHVLPTWYPIPRTSNNIFGSLIEKYLETPQTFQRYLSELNLGDPKLEGIVHDLFNSPDHKIYSSEICEKYNLSDEEFAEHMLHLEFNFVCCLIYEKNGDEWIEIVTLFQEWKDYLGFLSDVKPRKLPSDVTSKRPNEFSFVEDMSTVLSLALSKALFLELDQSESWVPDRTAAKHVSDACNGCEPEYACRVVQKILFLKLGRVEGRLLIPTDDVSEWMTLPLDKRALNTYKYTLKHYSYEEFSPDVCSERNIHEIEKSISRILDSDWVYLEDFLKGIIAPISENSKMVLKKTGRYWKYTLPDYSDEEKNLIQTVICDWLFEGDVISLGAYKGKQCLRITSLGQSMFG